MANYRDTLQADALPCELYNPQRNLEFRKLLKDIEEELIKRDVEVLKFLCRDVIPASQLEEIKRGIGLFQELEAQNKLGPENVNFLAECLMAIQRTDLVNKLRRLCVEDFTARGEVSLYRKHLLQISEELTKKEVASMIYLATPHLGMSKLKSDKIKTPLQLFIAMEHVQLITAHDVCHLATLLTHVRRPDLAVVTQHYQASTENASSLTAGWGKNICPGGLVAPGCLTVPVNMAEPVQHGFQEAPPFPARPEDKVENLTISNMEAQAHQSGAEVNRIPLAVVRQFDQLQIDPNRANFTLPSYKMNASPKGYCLIINNLNFYEDPEDSSSRRMANRIGTHVDAVALEKAFQKMDFLVDQKADLTDTGIVQVCNEFAAKDHSNFDCFVCCILSHGVKDNVFGSNGRLVPISDLTSCFKAGRCPQLNGKPKLFFMQACQGKDRQEGFHMEVDAPGDELVTIPNEADFLLGYATVPGFVSYRSKVTGSWYITKLCEILEEFWTGYDIMEILTMVNHEVSLGNAAMKDGRYKQVPAPMTTLRKKLYFKQQ